MKIAIPLTNGQLSAHFGHCGQFGIYEVDDGKIIASKLETPPAHEPGVNVIVGLSWDGGVDS